MHRDGDPGADTGRGEPHADVHIAVAADVKAVEPVGTESGQHAVAGAEDAGAVAGVPSFEVRGVRSLRCFSEGGSRRRAFLTLGFRTSSMIVLVVRRFCRYLGAGSVDTNVLSSWRVFDCF